MKILLVGDFSKPYTTFNWIAKSLKQLGQQIKCVSENKRDFKIIEKIRQFKPDVLLFSKGNIGGRLEAVLNCAKNEGVLTVCWLFDLYFKTPREPQVYSHPRFKADIVLTTDGGHQEKFEEAGINHICLRQGIFQDEAYISKEKIKAPEIVFIGSDIPWYPNRERLIKFLERTYKDKFGRYGTKDKIIRGKSLNKLLASTKIVVGDTVPSPNYWSNRIYEVLGRGGFLIHPKIPGREKEFEYWKHFVPYDQFNFNQLKEIIDFYLTHDEEREKIRLAGHKFCKENYTYLKRCEKFLEIVREYLNKKEVNIQEKSKLPEVTAILLPYTRAEQYDEWLENIKSQEGVSLTIWTWDSLGTLPEKDGVLTFRDPYNFGVYWRWELAKYVPTKYVLLIDDDVFFKDKYVLRDTIEAKKKYPEDSVVGWKGVILKGKYSESIHIRSERVKKDTKVDFVKVNYLLFERDGLRKTKILPFEILEIDRKADGEFWYMPQMGDHYVIRCLANRLDNSRTLGKGKETRKDHFEKQDALVEYSLKCHKHQKT